jgi:tetratricopeptide (TPR) repeat protein
MTRHAAPAHRLLTAAALLALAGAPHHVVADARGAVSGTIAPDARTAGEIAPSVQHAARPSERIERAAWGDDDLDTPAHRARAALIAGVLDDPSLSSEQADPLDRAEAALLRGEIDDAIEILDPHEDLAATARGRRIIAEALELMARLSDADRLLDPILAADPASLRSPLDAAEVIRAARLRGRLRSQPVPPSDELASLVSGARSDDPGASWPLDVELAARLLEHEDYASAGALLERVIGSAPACATALYQWGLARLGQHDLADVERAAEALDQLAARFPIERGQSRTIYADFLRARLAIRRCEPEAAIELLRPWERRLPDMPELLALNCAAQAVRPIWPNRELEDLLATYEQLTGGSPLAMFEVGRALADIGKHDSAAEYLVRAHRVQPKWAQPLTRLGLLELNAGRDIVARDVLAQALAIDPASPVAHSVSAFVEASLSFETLQTRSFRIRYQPGPDAVLAREIASAVEWIRNDAIDAGVSVPGERVVIELVPRDTWFALRTNREIDPATLVVAADKRIVVRPPRHGEDLSAGPYDWQRALVEAYRTMPHAIACQREAAPGRARPGEQVAARIAFERSEEWNEHRRSADDALADADIPMAVRHLDWLADHAFTTHEPAAELARLYAARGAWDSALAAVDRATDIAPYNAALRELAAAIAIEAEAFDQAERHLRALIDLEPQRERHRTRLEALRRLIETPRSEPAPSLEVPDHDAPR